MDFRQRGKSEFAEEAVELAFHAAKPRVSAQACNCALREFRLLRVEFPGMEIDTGGLSFFTVDAADAGRRIAIREQAQISAATHGSDLSCGESHRGNGDFNKRPGCRVHDLSM